MTAVDRLVAALAARSGTPVSDPAAVGAELEERLQRARRAWPGVELRPERFAEYLAERMPTELPAAEALGQLNTTDLYLACACVEADARALALFETRIIGDVGGVLAKFDRSGDAVAEVKQRLRERLLVGPPPRIAEYAGRGAIAAWVRVAATRIAMNLVREWKRRRGAERLAGRVASTGPADPELTAIRRRHGPEVEAAFRKALARLDAEQRHLLRLHYVDGVSLQKIAHLRRVDRSTASRRVAAARDQLLDDVRGELAGRLRIGREAFDGLLTDLRSQLHVSLDRLLGGP